jgi:hypothetical protein
VIGAPFSITLRRAPNVGLGKRAAPSAPIGKENQNAPHERRHIPRRERAGGPFQRDP